MVEQTGSVWPEQEVIDKWIAKMGIKVSHKDLMVLKRSVTDIRLEVQRELREVNGALNSIMNNEDSNPWRVTEEEIPVIPEGRYGVPVIVAYIDPCNHPEIHDYCTGQISYHKGHLGHGPEGFYGLAHGYGEEEWMLFDFEVTHWKYLPKHPLDK